MSTETYLLFFPLAGREVSLRVGPEVYMRKLKDCCMLSVSAMARVVETKQIFTKKDDVRLRKPHLSVKVLTGLLVAGWSDGCVGLRGFD